jgi:hypothetical protein
MDMQSDHADPPEEPKPHYTTSRGRMTLKRQYADAETSEDDGHDDVKKRNHRGRSGADQLFDDDVEATNASKSHPVEDDDDEDDDEEEHGPRKHVGRRRNEVESLGGFIVVDDDSNTRRTRLRTRQEQQKKAQANGTRSGRKKRITRNSARAGYEDDKDDNYVDHPSSLGSADGDGSLDDDVLHTSSDLCIEPEPEAEPEPEPEDDGKPYSLRQRQPINYAIPPPLDELSKPPARQPMGRHNKGGLNGAHKKRGLGWSASGAELSRWIRMPGDDSVGFIYAHLFNRIVHSQ